MSNSAEHPPRQELVAFGLGKLGPDESSQIEEHLDFCEECHETLLSLADDTFTGLVRSIPEPRVESSPSLDVDGQSVLIPDEEIAAAESCNAGVTDGAAADHGDRQAESVVPVELPAELVHHPRYRIVELIGKGGMGNVYRAQHRLMNRPVALKLINSQWINHPQAVERFRREVQAAAQLAHSNIVAAYDAEQAGDIHFLAMEFVDGINLAEVVKRRGPLPVNEACEYVRQAAFGLQHAHEKGMVHRDIKPHNLMLEKRRGVSTEEQEPDTIFEESSGARLSSLGAPPSIKILDFGLAGFASEVAYLETDGAADNSHDDTVPLHLTAVGSVMGTPDYIAPEQARDAHSADIRADIYSLGCTLYFLLTGRPPFADGDVAEKLHAHATQTPSPLHEQRDDVSTDLSGIVSRMLAKTPEDRFAEPRDVAAALSLITIKPQPDGAGARRRKRLLTARVMLLPLIMLAGMIVYLATDTGLVEIDAKGLDLPGAKVVLLRDGKEYATFDLKRAQEFHTVRAGKYEVQVRSVPNDVDVNVWTKTGQTNNWGEPDEHELDPVVLYRGGGMLIRVLREQSDPEQPQTPAQKPKLTPTQLIAIAGHDGLVKRVVFSSDGKSVLSGGENGRVLLHDVKSGNQLREFSGHTRTILSLAFSPDGQQILSSGWDGTIRTWEVASGDNIRTINGGDGLLHSATWSPDGSRILSCSHVGTAGGAIRLWDALNGELLREFEDVTFQPFEVVLSPDGATALSGGHDAVLRLWDVATGKVMRSFHGHRDWVRCVAFSKDGQRAISGSKDATVRIWNVSTGEELHRLAGHGALVESVVVTPDDRQILSASFDGTVKLWDAATGKEQIHFDGHTRPVSSAVLSSDGRLAATAGADGIVRIWQLPKRPSRNVMGDDRVIVTLTKEGRYLVDGRPANDAVELMNRLKSVMEEHPSFEVVIDATEQHGVEPIRQLEMMARQLGATRVQRPDWAEAPASMRSQPANEITLVDSLRGHSSAGVGRHCLATSADGRFLLSCGGPVALYWDIANRRLVRTLAGPTVDVAVVALSPDGKHAAGVTTQGEAYLWSLETGEPTYLNKVGRKNSAGIAFSPDSSLLVTSSNQGHAFAWSVPSGEEVARHNTVEYWWDCLVMADNETVAIALGSQVKFLNLKSGKSETKVRYSTAVNCTSVAMSADEGTLLVGTKWFKDAVEQDKGVHVWNTAEWREVQRCDGPAAAVTSVDFLPGERHIIAGGEDGRIFIWDRETGREVARKEGLGHLASAVVPLTDGRHAVSFGSWYADKTNDPIEGDFAIRLWQLPESVWPETELLAIEPAGKLAGDANTNHALHFLPDGKRVVSGGKGQRLVVWDIATGQQLKTLPWDQRIRRMLPLPDDRVVTGGENGGVRIWNLDEPEKSINLPPHEKLVMALAVSPDGKRLVTGSYNDIVRLWNLEEGHEIHRVDAHCGGAAFVDGGRQVVHLDGHKVVVRDGTTFEIVRTVAEVAAHRHLLELAVSADGKYVAFGDIDLFIYDLITGKEVARMPVGTSTMLRGMVFLSGSHTLVAGNDTPQIRLIDATSGKVLVTRELESHSAMCLTVSPDSTTLASSGGTWKSTTGQYLDDPDKTIYLWQLPESLRPGSTSPVSRLPDQTTGILTNPPSVPTGGLPIGRNLIADPSLENTQTGSLPQSWSAWLDDGPNFKCEVVEGGVNGKHCLQISGTGTRGVVFATSLPLDRTKRYALKGRVKVEGEAGTWAVVKLNYFNSTGWLGVDDRVGVTTNDLDWKFFEKTDAADQYPAATLIVPTCHIEGNGTAWFDDLEIIAYDREKLPDNFDATHGKNDRMR